MILVILTAVVSLGILLIIVAFSASMYHKARKLNPYNLKKDRLQSAIAAGATQMYLIRNEIKRLNEEKLSVQRIIDQKEIMEKFINEFQETYDNENELLARLKDDIKDVKGKVDAACKELEDKNMTKYR